MQSSYKTLFYHHVATLHSATTVIGLQVMGNTWGTYRIVEKVQETSSDTGVHNKTITELQNSECVLENRDTPTAGNNLIPISVLIYSPPPQVIETD